MLTTGYQLAAARALLGMEQATLAEQSGFSVTTIRNMERAGVGPIAGRSANVQTVQRALEAAGVEFLNHGQPGVRLHARIAAANLLDQQKPMAGTPLDPKALADFHRREHKKEHG